MARPGIMLYFDILEPIKVLPDADKGRLLVAMLEYGQDGIAPEFDGMLALAWGFVKPKIDSDSDAYHRTILKRQYATFCRDCKRKGTPEISFDEWLMAFDNGEHQVISSDIKWHPTTSTSTTTTTNTTTSTTAATTTTDSALPVCDFSPPSLEAVRAYCDECGYSISPERFVQYYTERGWMVGKDRMTDWQAVVRRWADTEQGSDTSNDDVDPLILKAVERAKARLRERSTEGM